MREQDIVRKISAVRDMLRSTGVMRLHFDGMKLDKTASISFLYFTLVFQNCDDEITKKRDEVLVIMRSLFPDDFVDLFVVREDQLNDLSISIHSENLLL